MNRRLEMVLLVGLLVVMSVCFTRAQETDKSPPKFQVDVHVSCDNSILKSEIESYLNRELRSLGDVEIVDNSSEHALSVIVIEETYVGGEKKGTVSLAVLGLLRINPKQLFSLQKIYDIPAEVFVDATFDAVFGYRRNYFFQLIVNIQKNNVKRTCEEIVAGFDTDMIEPERQKR